MTSHITQESFSVEIDAFSKAFYDSFDAWEDKDIDYIHPDYATSSGTEYGDCDQFNAETIANGVFPYVAKLLRFQGEQSKECWRRLGSPPIRSHVRHDGALTSHRLNKPSWYIRCIKVGLPEMRRNAADVVLV